MNTIIIHTGKSAESVTGKEMHPVSNVLLAEKIFKKEIKNNRNLVLYSNSTDFVSAMSALAEAKGIPIVFFINGVKGDIEKVFENFNRALDLINEISQK
jgi:hypothetical protein